MSDIVSCEELRKLMTVGGQLIDVRSPMEFNQGALDGAVNMPLDTFQHMANSIDQTKPVLLYCRSGLRSGAAKKFLDMLGFDSVYNIGSYQKYAFCN